MFRSQGKLQEDLEMNRLQLDAGQHLCGPTLHLTAMLMNGFGNVHAEQGNLDEAESRFRRALGRAPQRAWRARQPPRRRCVLQPRCALQTRKSTELLWMEEVLDSF